MGSQVYVIEVGFGRGWDTVEHRLVGRISRDAAQAMHKSGQPYCMVLSDPEGPPIFVTHVDTGNGYLGYTVFDRGRPSVQADFYRFDEVLTLRKIQFDDHEADVSFTVDIQPDGRSRTDLRSQAGSFQQCPRIPAEHRVIPESPFGTLLFDEAWYDIEVSFQYIDALLPGPGSADPDVEVRWSAPDLTSARPHCLNALFTPGARLQSLGRDKIRAWTVEEPEFIGEVRMPTGRVVATDPALVDDRSQPFTVEVAPGDYAQYLAHVREDGQGWAMVVAAKLEITRHPTVTWELALTPGQDLAFLGKDEYFGFGVDTGMGAFLDHSGCTAMADVVDASFQIEDDDAELHPDGFGEFRDGVHGTGTNMITYPSGYGDGAYPVWIGRDADGQVTCFIADMRVVGPAELESPLSEPEPSYIEAQCPDRSSWAPTVADAVLQLAATVRFFGEMVGRSAEAHARFVRGRPKLEK